jgi:ATP synthase, Delta/Epsilon chain, beta-sandwich domain
MRRAIFTSSRRAYSASCRASFAEELDGPKHLTVNFCTPHESIFVKKQVEKVTVPGEGGDVGLTFGHSPIICQLKPGLLTFSYIDVSYLFPRKTAQLKYEILHRIALSS